jgi:hypothetical protein
MKATIEFNLPEEKHEHGVTIAAPELYAALCDIDSYLRNEIKHGNSSDEVKKFAETIRTDYLNDLIWRLQ